MNIERNTVERRFIGRPVVARAAAEDAMEAMVIEGVAAVMESRTLLMEWNDFKVYEEIAPGAFDGVLQDDCRCLFNHNSNHILGRTTNETLKIEVIDNELRYSNTMPDTALAKDVYTLIKRGDVNQCSFQFTIEAEDRIELGKNEVLYRITKVGRLYDVGPVTFPAYENTSVSARDLEKIKQQLAERSEKENADNSPAHSKYRSVLRLHNANTINQ